MNISEAKQISISGITVAQLKETLQAAHKAGAANDKRSKVNKVLSKAMVYNIMVKGYMNHPDDEIIEGIHCISAKNILREFGEFWTGWTPEKPEAQNQPDFVHEDAIDFPF